MGIIGWQELTCSCGNKFFVPAYTLQWHENQGSSQRQDGWICTGCNKRSDNNKMIATVKAQSLQVKIDELRAQQEAGTV